MLSLDRLYFDLPLIRPGSWRAYLLAVLAVAVATLLRVVLAPWLVGMQFITLFPAIIAVTLLCGVRVGLFAAVLAALARWWFVTEPPIAFPFDRPGNVLTVLLAAGVGMAGVLIVGALRTALLRLRRAHASLSAVIEAYPDALLLLDPAHRIVRANAMALAMFGHPAEELIGAPVDLLVPEALRERHVAHCEKFHMETDMCAMAAGLEPMGRRRDGSVFPVNIRIGRITEAGPALLVVILRDLTGEKAAAVALAESRRQQALLAERERRALVLRRWADTFEKASFGIAISDASSPATIDVVNPAFAAMLGMTPAELHGRPARSLYDESELGRIPALIAAADRDGRVSYECLLRRGDGSTLPAQFDVTSVRGAGGQIEYRIASVLDITLRRRTEEALRQAHKMEAIGTVAGGMAHDFNNLLGTILGNLELTMPLLADGSPALAHIEAALEAGLRGTELNHRLLAFARRQQLRPVRVQVNDLVAGMAGLLRRALGERIVLLLRPAPGLRPVVADTAQLEAALLNLATNARDAMPQGGTVSIVTANRTLDAAAAARHGDLAVGDYVAIEMTDTGTGMTPDVAARIFDPFFTTKPEGKGTGLGLSMVFGFAQQSGGHVGVDSTSGGGTTVRLLLPAAPGPPPPVPAAPPESGQAAAGHGESVLVVEDNTALRRVVARQLAGLGYVVREADSVATALAALAEAPVRLVFSDVMMPGPMDGFELAQVVAARWPGTAVLLTSGFAQSRSRAGQPTVPLLAKPFRRTDLAEAVRRALDAQYKVGGEVKR